MSSQFRIGVINPLTTGVVTASSNASGFPCTAIQSQSGSSLEAWQTTSDSAQWLRCDLGAICQIDCFGLFRTNLSSAATIRARIFSDSGFATAIYDSTTVPANPVFGQTILLGGTTGRYIQIDLNDASNSDGFINVPLGFVGPLAQFAIGYSPQSALSSKTGNFSNVTHWGNASVSQYWTARIWNVNLTGIRDAEWPSLQDMDIASRMGKNMLFIPDVTANVVNRESVFGICQFNQGIGFSGMSHDLRTAGFQITERL